jgi:hypothetical protein
VAWEIDFTPEAEAWLKGLSKHDRARMTRQIEKVHQGGPKLGRPTVDSLKGSRHSNMKEIRVQRTGLRMLFAFDREQRGIVLTGTNRAKTKHVFSSTISRADHLLDIHQKASRRESAWRGTRAGTRSAESSR